MKKKRKKKKNLNQYISKGKDHLTSYHSNLVLVEFMRRINELLISEQKGC